MTGLVALAAPVLVLLGVLLARSVAGRAGNGRDPWARSALSAGWGLGFTLAGLAFLEASRPFGWTNPAAALARLPPGHAMGPPDLVRTWGAVTLGLGILSVIGMVAGALWMRSRVIGARLRAMSGGSPDLWGAVLAIVSAILATASIAARPGAWLAFPIELSAAATLAGLTLATRLLAVAEEPRARTAPDSVGDEPSTQSAAAPRPVDPAATLHAALLVDLAPAYEWDELTSTEGAGSDLDNVWRSTGALGPAPLGMAPALDAIGQGGAVLLPDLPDVTARAFVATLLHEHQRRAAGRALVVSREADVQPLAEMLERIHAERPTVGSGLVVTNPADLRAAFDAKRSPRTAILGFEHFVDAGLQALHWNGRGFVQDCDLVILCRPDRLAPIRFTHLRYAVRRLEAMTQTSLKRRAFLATAPDTTGVRRALEHVIGRKMEVVATRLRSRSRVRLYWGLLPRGEGEAGVQQAVREAHDRLVRAGVDVAVEDGEGLLAHERLEGPRRESALVPVGSLDASVVLATAFDGAVPSIYRSARHCARNHGPHGQIVVIWSVASPITNFLKTPRQFGALEQGGRLPAPAPVFAPRNRHLIRLHLNAALHDGLQPEAEMARIFDDAVVREQIERKVAVPRGEAAFVDRESGRLLRSRLLTASPATPRPVASRITVTEDTVQVVDSATGEIFDTLDRHTARTHYYPGKTFSYRGRRYLVPLEAALSATSQRIHVTVAASDLPITRPRLTFAIEPRSQAEILEARPIRHISVKTGIVPVRVSETIDGAASEDGRGDRSFAPIHADYGTVIRVVWLDGLRLSASELQRGLRHAARTLDDVVRLHLHVPDENLEVEARPDGCAGDDLPALLFVDRHIGGIGVAEALDLDAVCELFHWSRSLMKSCGCTDGCERCTPFEVRSLKAKQAAMQVLGG